MMRGSKDWEEREKEGNKKRKEEEETGKRLGLAEQWQRETFGGDKMGAMQESVPWRQLIMATSFH